MSVNITRISAFNIVGNVVLYSGAIGTFNNIQPRKGMIKSRSDLASWVFGKVLRRETNIQLVARRNAKKQFACTDR